MNPSYGVSSSHTNSESKSFPQNARYDAAQQNTPSGSLFQSDKHPQGIERHSEGQNVPFNNNLYEINEGGTQYEAAEPRKTAGFVGTGNIQEVSQSMLLNDISVNDGTLNESNYKPMFVNPLGINRSYVQNKSFDRSPGHTQRSIFENSTNLGQYVELGQKERLHEDRKLFELEQNENANTRNKDNKANNLSALTDDTKDLSQMSMNNFKKAFYQRDNSQYLDLTKLDSAGMKNSSNSPHILEAMAESTKKTLNSPHGPRKDILTSSLTNKNANSDLFKAPEPKREEKVNLAHQPIDLLSQVNAVSTIKSPKLVEPPNYYYPKTLGDDESPANSNANSAQLRQNLIDSRIPKDSHGMRKSDAREIETLIRGLGSIDLSEISTFSDNFLDDDETPGGKRSVTPKHRQGNKNTYVSKKGSLDDLENVKGEDKQNKVPKDNFAGNYNPNQYLNEVTKPAESFNINQHYNGELKDSVNMYQIVQNSNPNQYQGDTMANTLANKNQFGQSTEGQNDINYLKNSGAAENFQNKEHLQANQNPQLSQDSAFKSNTEFSVPNSYSVDRFNNAPSTQTLSQNILAKNSNALNLPLERQNSDATPNFANSISSGYNNFVLSAQPQTQAELGLPSFNRINSNSNYDLTLNSSPYTNINSKVPLGFKTSDQLAPNQAYISPYDTFLAKKPDTALDEKPNLSEYLSPKGKLEDAQYNSNLNFDTKVQDVINLNPSMDYNSTKLYDNHTYYTDKFNGNTKEDAKAQPPTLGFVQYQQNQTASLNIPAYTTSKQDYPLAYPNNSGLQQDIRGQSISIYDSSQQNNAEIQKTTENYTTKYNTVPSQSYMAPYLYDQEKFQNQFTTPLYNTGQKEDNRPTETLSYTGQSYHNNHVSPDVNLAVDTKDNYKSQPVFAINPGQADDFKAYTFANLHQTSSGDPSNRKTPELGVSGNYEAKNYLSTVYNTDRLENNQPYLLNKVNSFNQTPIIGSSPYDNQSSINQNLTQVYPIQNTNTPDKREFVAYSNINSNTPTKEASKSHLSPYVDNIRSENTMNYNQNFNVNSSQPVNYPQNFKSSTHSLDNRESISEHPSGDNSKPVVFKASKLNNNESSPTSELFEYEQTAQVGNPREQAQNTASALDQRNAATPTKTSNPTLRVTNSSEKFNSKADILFKDIKDKNDELALYLNEIKQDKTKNSGSKPSLNSRFNTPTDSSINLSPDQKWRNTAQTPPVYANSAEKAPHNSPFGFRYSVQSSFQQYTQAEARQSFLEGLEQPELKKDNQNNKKFKIFSNPIFKKPEEEHILLKADEGRKSVVSNRDHQRDSMKIISKLFSPAPQESERNREISFRNLNVFEKASIRDRQGFQRKLNAVDDRNIDNEHPNKSEGRELEQKIENKQLTSPLKLPQNSGISHSQNQSLDVSINETFLTLREEGAIGKVVPVENYNMNSEVFQRKVLGFGVKKEKLIQGVDERKINTNNMEIICVNCQEFININLADKHSKICDKAPVEAFEDPDISVRFSVDEINEKLALMHNKIRATLQRLQSNRALVIKVQGILEAITQIINEDHNLEDLDIAIHEAEVIMNDFAESKISGGHVVLLMYMNRTIIIAKEKYSEIQFQDLDGSEIMALEDKLKEYEAETLKQKAELEIWKHQAQMMNNIKLSDEKNIKYVKAQYRKDNELLSNIHSDIEYSDRDSSYGGTSVASGFYPLQNDLSIGRRSVSENARSENKKIKFYSAAVNSKLSLSASHPGKDVLISDLYEECLRQNIPEEQWDKFIKIRLEAGH